MNKPTDKPDNNEEKISTVSNPIICSEKDCDAHALSLSKYCWKHMPEEEKSNYKNIIKKWFKDGNTLYGFILSESDLSEINLEGANLTKANMVKSNLSYSFFKNADFTDANLNLANLSGANLEKANLSQAKLKQSILYNARLPGAKLIKAHLENSNLSKAFLMEINLTGAWLLEAQLKEATLNFANLSYAKLHGTNLTGAVLKDAVLSNASFRGAILENALLGWTDLTNARNLNIGNFSKRLTDIEKKEPEGYSESYNHLKNHFIIMGQIEDASEAAYREKVLKRLSYSKKFWRRMTREYRERELLIKEFGFGKYYQSVKYLLCNPYEAIKTFAKIFPSWLFSLISGYGERPIRTIISAVIIFLTYGILYRFLGSFEQSQGFWDSLYFSIVTFTTLGLGDVAPNPDSILTRLLVASEAFIGAFIIGLFIWTLARKGAAR